MTLSRLDVRLKMDVAGVNIAYGTDNRDCFISESSKYPTRGEIDRSSPEMDESPFDGCVDEFGRELSFTDWKKI